MDKQTELEIEAATFRRLRDYLREHTEVQNIDLMNLAGFCRNCLSKWYRAEAEDRGEAIDYEAARERVYGMPYAEWKSRYQAEASAEQQARFAEREAQAKQDGTG
ncbi:MAG: DUF1244 domain-containing protein [Gammaproteobacteria bacterium]